MLSQVWSLITYSVEDLACPSILTKVISMRRKLTGCKPERNFTEVQEVLTWPMWKARTRRGRKPGRKQWIWHITKQERTLPLLVRE